MADKRCKCGNTTQHKEGQCWECRCSDGSRVVVCYRCKTNPASHQAARSGRSLCGECRNTCIDCGGHNSRKHGNTLRCSQCRYKHQKMNFPKCLECDTPTQSTSGYCIPCKTEKGLHHKSVPIGSKRLDSYGYVEVKVQNGHGWNNWKKEHTAVMEKIMGRQLYKGEEVHHLNGIRDDNRPENLELWVVSQPMGQRPADLVTFAREILAKYEKDFG